jgi:CheY-like chemotaxis protein
MTDDLSTNGPAPTSSLKTIAVIDDDYLVAEATRGLLRAWGYQVLTITSRAAAIAAPAYQGRQPDLIISDYRGPSLWTTVEANAQPLRWCKGSIPVLFITGDTAPDHLRELCTSGHRMLYKPVEPAILRAVIGQLLGE